MHERHRDKWVDLLILWRINAKPKMSEGIKDLYPTQNFNNQGLFHFKLNLWRLHRRIFNLLHCRHVNAGENDRKRHFPCQGIGKLRAEKQGARRRGLMRKRRGNSPTTPHAQHSAKQRRLGTMPDQGNVSNVELHCCPNLPAFDQILDWGQTCTSLRFCRYKSPFSKI